MDSRLHGTLECTVAHIGTCDWTDRRKLEHGQSDRRKHVLGGSNIWKHSNGQAVTNESILGEPEMLPAPYEFILTTDREDNVNAVKKKKNPREVKTKRTRKGNNLS